MTVEAMMVSLVPANPLFRMETAPSLYHNAAEHALRSFVRLQEIQTKPE